MDVENNNYYVDEIFNQKNDWIRKQHAVIFCLKKLSLALKIYKDREEKDGKMYFKQMVTTKQK